jgi:hypothetical protein
MEQLLYRDKKVVGVFVRFRAPLQQNTCSQLQNFLDDAYSFVLTDAVVIKQRIKPGLVVLKEPSVITTDEQINNTPTPEQTLNTNKQLFKKNQKETIKPTSNVDAAHCYSIF